MLRNTTIHMIRNTTSKIFLNGVGPSGNLCSSIFHDSNKVYPASCGQTGCFICWALINGTFPERQSGSVQDLISYSHAILITLISLGRGIVYLLKDCKYRTGKKRHVEFFFTHVLLCTKYLLILMLLKTIKIMLQC